MRVIRQIEASGLGPEEIRRLAEEAGDLSAQEYRKRGFHWSESVLRAVAHVLGLQPPPEVLMATTGFRGGGGGFRAQCGALNSGIMAVSLLYGRTFAEEDNQCASDMTRLLCERFQQEMGHLTCDVLREVYQCSSGQAGEGGTVYHTGARLAVEVILSAHQGCSTCGGFDGAVKRWLQSR